MQTIANECNEVLYTPDMTFYCMFFFLLDFLCFGMSSRVSDTDSNLVLSESDFPYEDNVTVISYQIKMSITIARLVKN